MIPETCPHCGAEIPEGAIACPECGSDERTGWSDRAAADRLDLPDGEFDYEAYVKEEFGPPTPIHPRRVGMLLWVIAGLVLLALLGGFLGR